MNCFMHVKQKVICAHVRSHSIYHIKNKIIFLVFFFFGKRQHWHFFFLASYEWVLHTHPLKLCLSKSKRNPKIIKRSRSVIFKQKFKCFYLSIIIVTVHLCFFPHSLCSLVYRWWNAVEFIIWTLTKPLNYVNGSTSTQHIVHTHTMDKTRKTRNN